MKFLIDTQIWILAAYEPERLPVAVAGLLGDRRNELVFSAVSIWEIAIKQSLGRRGFFAEARSMRKGLLERGVRELALTAEHSLGVIGLPHEHHDPFDRVLLAQAISESMLLITMDTIFHKYVGPVRVM